MSTPDVLQTPSTNLNTISYFSTVDYAIFTVLLIASLVAGTFAGWRSSSGDTKDFLTGGKSMNPVAITLSLLGGVVSALSVLGNTTEIYLYGTQLWMNLIGCFWGSLVVVHLLLPTIYPLGLSSMNQYLQFRFDSNLLKKLASITQIVHSAMYLGICLYAPSLTLSSVTKLSTWVSIIVLGIVCSIYISLGGVRAVVYTDVLQTTIMFIGVVSVVVQVCIELGGVGEVWERAAQGGRLEFFNFDPNPLVRHTFWSVQVLGLYFFVSTVGISQPQYQRLVSVRNLKISQSVCFTFMMCLAVLWSLFYFSGLVAYAAYEDCDPLGNGQIEKSDQILAFLVADKLRHVPGMAGVFVAAVAGAVLSSLSSQANAMVVMLWEDFLSGWWIFANVPVKSATNITRVLSVCMGLLSISMAFLVANLGTLFQTAYSISGALVSPMDGLFLTAVAAPWVSAKGATAGFVAALCFNLWIVVGKFTYGAGQSPVLPTSTAGCPEVDVVLDRALEGTQSSFLNATEYSVVNSSSGFSDYSQLYHNSSEVTYPKLYDISYCYLGMMGITIVMVVSTIVSFCTGPVKPDEANETYVNKYSLRFYRWICGCDSSEVKKSIEKGDDLDAVSLKGFSYSESGVLESA